MEARRPHEVRRSCNQIAVHRRHVKMEAKAGQGHSGRPGRHVLIRKITGNHTAGRVRKTCAPGSDHTYAQTTRAESSGRGEDHGNGPGSQVPPGTRTARPPIGSSLTRAARQVETRVHGVSRPDRMDLHESTVSSRSHIPQHATHIRAQRANRNSQKDTLELRSRQAQNGIVMGWSNLRSHNRPQVGS